MGILFTWLMGKPVNELKEMRKERIEKLTKESDPAKVEDLVKEIEAIDAEIAKADEA